MRELLAFKRIKYHVKSTSMVEFFPCSNLSIQESRNLNIPRVKQLSNNLVNMRVPLTELKRNRQKLDTDIIRRLTIFR